MDFSSSFHSSIYPENFLFGNHIPIPQWNTTQNFFPYQTRNSFPYQEKLPVMYHVSTLLNRIKTEGFVTNDKILNLFHKYFTPKSQLNFDHKIQIWKIELHNEVKGYIIGLMHNVTMLCQEQFDFLVKNTTKLISEVSLETAMNRIYQHVTEVSTRKVKYFDTLSDEDIFLKYFSSNIKPIIELETFEELYNYFYVEKAFDPEKMRNEHYARHWFREGVDALMFSGNLNIDELNILATESSKIEGLYDFHYKRELKWMKIIEHELKSGISLIQIGAIHAPPIIKQLIDKGYEIKMINELSL